MIEVAHLRKEYGTLVAVDDVSFTVRPGMVFGLLGPNGAGKSTSIGCVSGLLEPTAGTVRLLGQPVKKARSNLGIVPQELALYEDLSATENLRFWASAYGLRGADRDRAVAEALGLVELTDRAEEPVKDFSGGMKRRLNFACGIVHQPKILLLDEPTVGVDPQSRINLLDQVRAQAAAGTCVLYTTHYMEEAQALCDELAIVDSGKVVASGSLAELRTMMGEQDLLRLTGEFDPAATRGALAGLADVAVETVEEEALVLSTTGATRVLPEVYRILEGTGATVRETTLSQANLETLFIKLTGNKLRD